MMIAIGQRLGSWAIEDLVSMGGAQVFRGHHVEVGTPAMIKVSPVSKATTACQDREIAAIQSFRHESIPEVLDFGIDHERELVWTAFNWFDAEPVEDRMLLGRVDWRDGCALFRDLAGALAHVHAEGFLHRDIRPANVLVDKSWSAWLMGFDFAMTQEKLESLSHAPFGDLAYLAPEVLRDPTHHGPKADVYAFGCLMYEVLSGRASFPAAAWGERADQATRMLEWKARADPLDPGSECPDWLRSMVTKCTQPDPDRRLPDLDAMVGWLDAAKGTWMRTRLQPRTPPPSQPTSATPTMPPLISAAAPSLRPSLGGPFAHPQAPAPVVENRLPLMAQYFGAGTLGCLSALGFTAIIILFVELQRGTI